MRSTSRAVATTLTAAVFAGALSLTGALSASAVLPAAAAAPGLVSAGASAQASSTEGAYAAGNAVDGDRTTRWSSEFSDVQWLRIDLGAVVDLERLELDWEAAYAKAFTVSVSTDGVTWTRGATVADGAGGAQSVSLDGTGRYVRLDFSKRGGPWGYSLWEARVYGTPAGSGEPTDPGGPGGGTECAAVPAVAASATSEEGPFTAAKAIDGDATTRWASAQADGESLTLDLGSVQQVCRVDLSWEAAFGKAYRVDVSADGTSWSTAATVADGDGGADSVAVSADARYVRLAGVTRGTGYGYSLWEVQVRAGDGAGSPGNPPLTGGGDLGPNVHVYEDTTSDAQIQADLDAAFAQQESDQFGDGRFQFLFKPGSYDVHANVGFYTSVSGLGVNPTDVAINGGVWADAQWFGGNATQNFWRSVENLTINPHTGEARWAVSQAAPMRRVQVNGDLNLAPSSYGWSSGGYIADSKVTGTVRSYSQQQWLSRDSSFGAWEGSVWNMAFTGVQGAPAPHFPNPSHTVVDTTPVVAEKPYLYWDSSAGDYAVFVPGTRTDARGTSWANGPTQGRSIPLDDFYVAQPGTDAATINRALAQGLHLVLTPGVYHLDDTIRVDRADTVVLGLGFATIVNEGGVAAMRVADVDGVSVSGVLFDAGTDAAPVLLEVGAAGASADHADDPIRLHDVFLRVGGAVAGKVQDALVVNSDDVLIDHIWAWRGDHGEGIGWDLNTSRHGLVVNGDDVTAYGLFVEHFQQENTLWNGERGRTFFYQSELAYDAPNQAAWKNGDRLGWAGYRVGDDVQQHDAWAMGVYSYNNVDPSIVTESGFQVPERPGIRLRNLLTVSLGGNGIINHVVNGIGGMASGTDTIPSYLQSFH
ncbi:discoidin domain-containing protein [Microbacterium sp. NPDC058389]|uniref:discoidin domain-containing protein n=1 Tax=Microbacterium sp. NPDC058389 TaxID=3346475 RepID=UPI003647F137